jgi:hypothetical protein
MDELLAKPFHAHELALTLKRWLPR